MVPRPRTVADFYQEIVARLHALGLDTPIWTMPVEIPDAIPFEQDSLHAAYDPEYATRFWRILIQADRVLNEFRARFLGKVSPVIFSGAVLIWPSPAFPGGTTLERRLSKFRRLGHARSVFS